MITTMLPSGKLQTHPIWVGTDGERLVVNTETHRQKYRNVERDPNVTLTIRDEENPYRYAEVRGEIVEKVTGQEARDHIDELSRKYHGEDYPPENIVSERVMLWIVPSRQSIVDQSTDSID
jgi:PPOX class probable F420-dependent enzyme